MLDWPGSLVNDIARRRAVLLIGSGVSKHSIGRRGARPPTWKSFLKQALLDCPDEVPPYVQEAIGAGDYLHACEWLKIRYDDSWSAYLRKTFQTPGFVPSALHKAILSLDSRILFTLNFDDIYERAANETPGSHIVKNYYDPDVSEFLRGDGRYIVKVHGNLNSPEQLIFTQKDYSSARVKNAPFYQAFDACLLTHSFVFIGAGYADPDVNLLLENQAFSFPSNQPHYFLTSDNNNDDLKRSLRNNRNLKTINYEKVDDGHSGLLTEILHLVELVDEKRQELSTNTNW